MKNALIILLFIGTALKGQQVQDLVLPSEPSRFTKVNIALDSSDMPVIDMTTYCVSVGDAAFTLSKSIIDEESEQLFVIGTTSLLVRIENTWQQGKRTTTYTIKASDGIKKSENSTTDYTTATMYVQGLSYWAMVEYLTLLKKQ